MRSLLTLLGFLALTFAAAACGALFQPGDWYATLEKPSWNPPNWVFGPVWTVLYITIAFAGWWAWRTGQEGAPAEKVRIALTFWGCQLLANALWSWLFFGLHRPAWALLEILILWLLILGTVRSFWGLSRGAALLLLPYLGWVSFALWWLNR